MSNEDDAISKIKNDNVLLQRHRCGGCQRSLAQVPGFDATPVKNKKRANTDTAAMGAFCTDCQKDKMRSEEGPRDALWVDPNGDVRITFYDNLVDMEQSGTTTTPSTAEES